MSKQTAKTAAEKLAAARLYQKPGVALRTDTRKRDSKRAQRIKALIATGEGTAFEKAATIAMTIAIQKQKELDTGSRVTRRERSKMMKAINASVQAATHVGQMVTRNDAVVHRIFTVALGAPKELAAELAAAARHQPALAQRIAIEAGPLAVAAVEASIEAIAAQRAAASEKLAAALNQRKQPQPA